MPNGSFDSRAGNGFNRVENGNNRVNAQGKLQA
jgi:hypothetical protein